MTTKNEPFYNIKGESSACERIKTIDVDDETSLTIPLNEIGQFESIKVYNQAYVDNQQKRIEELENENAELRAEYLQSFAHLKCLEWKNIKAKEIISKLLTRLHNFTYTGLNCEECKEAEQFIKEIGE